MLRSQFPSRGVEDIVPPVPQELEFITPRLVHNQIYIDLARIPRRLLNQVVKTKLVGMYMYIIYTTQCCYTTREVITTALDCKHWIYLPGQAKRA